MMQNFVSIFNKNQINPNFKRLFTYCPHGQNDSYSLLKLNLSKCSILTTVSVTEDLSDVYYQHSCEKVKDLGVIIDSKLSFEGHIIGKVNKAYSILGLIKRNFAHVGKESFVLLYKT